MANNDLTLTLLLRFDGSQASVEMQRLTAQISSQLSKLNKPNDGAAAAAIAVQKQQAQTVVQIQKETNAAVESLQRQRSTSLIAQANAENAAIASLQRQRSSALIAEEKVRSAAAESLQRQRSAALTAQQREFAKSRANAEKRIQAEAAAAAVSLQKQRSTALIAEQRAFERQALADIRRFERERQQIATQNANAIAKLAKQEADTRIREGRRAASEVINQLRQQARATQATLSTRTNSFIAGAAGGVAALVGVSAVSEIRQAGAAWIDYSSKLETTRIAFTTMLGSAQLAEEHLKDLQQFALKTPFQFSELIDASQRMQALGFRAEQVIPILNDVGNAVAAAGGGSERLDRVTLALSQIQSKGKVMTQELNQLAEAGIPAFRILQETLHKSRSEINELTKDGQISSKVFLEAFQKFSQQNFGGLMEQQSRTFSGAMSNIKDALLVTSATAFEPLYAKLTELALRFADAATNSQKFKDQLKTVGEVSATIFDGLVEVVRAVTDGIAIAVSSITGQIEALIHALAAVEFAAVAVITRGAAMGRQLRGDLAGAAELSARANLAMAESLREAERAFTASGAAARKVIEVYKEAEERAKALANAQAKVGGEPVIGAGILRKKQTDTEDDSTKKNKGPDPAIAEKRVAEITRAILIANLAAEEEDLKRSLTRRAIDFGQYVAAIEAKESARHLAFISGLHEEAEAAAKLRNDNQKTIALQEIELKRTQEQIRHQKALNDLADEGTQRTRKRFESERDIILQSAETSLRIGEIVDSSRLASIESLAVARVKSEEQAEREILKIRLGAIDRQNDAIRVRLTAAKSILDPEERAKAENDLNNQLKINQAEREAIQEDGNRAIDEGRQRDVHSARQYADDLKQIQDGVADSLRDNQQLIIDLMIEHNARRLDILGARVRLELDDETARHERAEDSIAAQRIENAESNRTREEKDAKTAELNRLAEAEEERHRLEIKRIRDAETRELERLDPTSNRSLFGDTFTENLARIREEAELTGQSIGNLSVHFQAAAETAAQFFQQQSEEAGNFASIAGGAVQTFTDGLKQMISAWVLTGETGPAALRKLTAQVLAQVAAQAAVKAIFELAEGFALLFVNPAASASHFTAAAIYGSVAGAAALVGRKVAGNLFKQPSSGSGSASTTSGTGQISTANLARNSGTQQQVVRHEHVIRVVSNDSHILDVVSKDYRNGGSTREMVLSDGGVSG